MRTADVLAHFKTQQATADALGIKQPSVALWGEFPPDRRQLQIEGITEGTLKAEEGCRKRVLGTEVAWDGVTDRRKNARPA